jgi:hypothetical protein
MSEEGIFRVIEQFARYGLLDISFSDNEPQFNFVEIRKFAKDWDFSHETSSPLFQQSNAKVEHAVQTNKSLIKKNKHSQLDPYWAILDIRNTPTEGGRCLRFLLKVFPSM